MEQQQKRPNKNRKPYNRNRNRRQQSKERREVAQVKANEKKSLFQRLLGVLTLKKEEPAPTGQPKKQGGGGGRKQGGEKRQQPQGRPEQQKQRPPRQPKPPKAFEAEEAAQEPQKPQRQECRRIIVSKEALETRVALLTGKKLEEYRIERSNDERISGGVFLGRVVNLEPSLEAAFVDIGAEKNAFLHYRDILPMTHDLSERVSTGEAAPTAGKKRDVNSKLAARIRKLEEAQAQASNDVIEREIKVHSGQVTVKDIPKLFPSGSEVLVQVSKSPIGTKGARVTANISIPGRYLVLLPYSDHISISKKITDRKERERLRRILSSFELPKGLGLICRTVGEGRRREHFENDLSLLLEIWQNIENGLKRPKPPVCLYREPGLLEETVRDSLTEDIDEIIVDSDDAYETLVNRIKAVVGEDEQTVKIKRHHKKTPIFDEYGVSRQISQIFSRTVPLKSGAYLVIEETEALVSIDVNSGRAKTGKDLPETILTTNLEAAEEIARQMRLRNLGGLIVIDFIDMQFDRNKREVYQTMKKFLKEDRARTDMSHISKFGLMELTRRREEESLLRTVYDNCPYCGGSGKIRSAFSISVEIHRCVQETLKRNSDEPIRVLTHPDVLARIKKEDAEVIDDLEKRFGASISFRTDPSLRQDEFKLVNPTTGKDYPC